MRVFLLIIAGLFGATFAEWLGVHGVGAWVFAGMAVAIGQVVLMALERWTRIKVRAPADWKAWLFFSMLSAITMGVARAHGVPYWGQCLLTIPIGLLAALVISAAQAGRKPDVAPVEDDWRKPPLIRSPAAFNWTPEMKAALEAGTRLESDALDPMTRLQLQMNMRGQREYETLRSRLADCQARKSAIEAVEDLAAELHRRYPTRRVDVSRIRSRGPGDVTDTHLDVRISEEGDARTGSRDYLNLRTDTMSRALECVDEWEAERSGAVEAADLPEKGPWNPDRQKALDVRDRVTHAADLLSASKPDVESWCMLRLAELRKSGETEAALRIAWKRVGNQTVYTLQIRRADKTIESAPAGYE